MRPLVVTNWLLNRPLDDIFSRFCKYWLNCILLLNKDTGIFKSDTLKSLSNTLSYLKYTQVYLYLNHANSLTNNRHCLKFLFCDNFDVYIGQAIRPVKGHESKSYKTPCSIASLFFNFTHVKM